MIDLTTNTPHVVDEWWFVDVNESTGVEIRLIGEDTLSKCMEIPNKPTALSTTDRRNISRYVKSIKISSQIIKLKQVTHENSEKEEKVKKFKNHISTSKISFIGYDVKNNYHKISEN